MSKPNYRAILSFDAERKMFQARAPELEHCTAEGATRAEACAKLEEEIDAQLANMLSHGSTPPRSVDEEEFSGEVSGKLSKALHRELAYLARSEGIEIAQLVSEMLAAGVEARRSGSRGPRSAGRADGNRADGNRADNHGNIGNSNGNRGGRGANGTQFLDDRANFIEYVRTLDQTQSQPTSHGMHRGAPPAQGAGGHGGANRGGGHQQRRRGGGGGGGGGHQARGGHDRGHQGGNPGNGRPSGPPRAHEAAPAPHSDVGNRHDAGRHNDE